MHIIPEAIMILTSNFVQRISTTKSFIWLQNFYIMAVNMSVYHYAIPHKTWGDCLFINLNLKHFKMFVGEGDEKIVQHFARVCWLTSQHSEYIFQRRILETLSIEDKLHFNKVCPVVLSCKFHRHTLLIRENIHSLESQSLHFNQLS